MKQRHTCPHVRGVARHPTVCPAATQCPMPCIAALSFGAVPSVDRESCRSSFSSYNDDDPEYCAEYFRSWSGSDEFNESFNDGLTLCIPPSSARSSVTSPTSAPPLIVCSRPSIDIHKRGRRFASWSGYELGVPHEGPVPLVHDPLLCVPSAPFARVWGSCDGGSAPSALAPTFGPHRRAGSPAGGFVSHS